MSRRTTSRSTEKNSSTGQTSSTNKNHSNSPSKSSTNKNHSNSPSKSSTHPSKTNDSPTTLSPVKSIIAGGILGAVLGRIYSHPQSKQHKSDDMYYNHNHNNNNNNNDNNDNNDDDDDQRKIQCETKIVKLLNDNSDEIKNENNYKICDDIIKKLSNHDLEAFQYIKIFDEVINCMCKNKPVYKYTSLHY